jgi:uncharacterized membrane-anchored protein
MPEAIARPVEHGFLNWLKVRERKILLMTAAAQLLVLVAMIASRAIPLVTGQTVLVRVQPVDPRDLFRGDYVTLSYDFSRARPDSIQGLSPDERARWSRLEGRTVYVPLVPDTDRMHWRAERVTVVKPDGGTFLKGRMTSYGRLLFGIEAYYLQEGSGHVYEQALRQRHLSAELAVTSGGQAALRNLRIE